jgi:hypothetical protein
VQNTSPFITLTSNEQTRLRRLIARSREKLHGPQGLLIAIVAQAYIDALDNDIEWRDDALSFFQSPHYALLLDRLDLDPCLLPLGLHLTMNYTI